MGRLIAAFKQFSDGAGVPLAGGKLEFFFNKTADKKTTFSDDTFLNENPNPVPLDGEGYPQSPIFGQGLYSINLLNSSDEFVIGFDDVSPEGGTGSVSFANWSGTTAYLLPAYVTGSDSAIYKAITASTNIDPVTDDGSTWIKVEFISFYSAFVTYSLGQEVKVTGDDVYKSLKNSNIGNDPVTDGGVNWELENPTQNWVTGRVYNIGEKSIGSDGRTYKSVVSQSGNDPVSDSGTNWLPVDGTVQKPVNVSPADTATGVSRFPILTTDAFTVLGSSAAQEWSQFQLSLDNFSTVIYDSDITRDLTEHTVETKLDAVTTYSYRMIKKGVRTDISEFSDVTTFTTVFPLSSSYSNDLKLGTGLARTVVTEVDLLSQSGFVFITNLDVSTPMRLCSTTEGVGNAKLVDGAGGFIAEATGLTSFNSNGYSVGTDSDYNGNGDDIFSMIFQSIAKFSTIVSYSGNNTNRLLTHNLGSVPGTYIIAPTTVAPFTGNMSIRFNAGVSSAAIMLFGGAISQVFDNSAFNSLAATSTDISIGTSTSTNGGTNDYIALLFADDVDAGIVSGFYTGTADSLNSIVTGFRVSTFLTKNVDSNEEWVIFDSTLGTSQHIIMNQNSLGVVGGLQSFNSDGITLNSSVANTSGDQYYFMAVADKDFF